MADFWTISALSNATGIGKFQDEVIFDMPIGQNGATSGKYFLDNGGTAPVFTTNSFKYKISRNGKIYVAFLFNGDGGTDGASAVQLLLPCPYIHQGTTNAYYTFMMVKALGQTTLTGGPLIFGMVIAGLTEVYFYYNTSTTASIIVTNAMFSDGNRFVQGTVEYPAF